MRDTRAASVRMASAPGDKEASLARDGRFWALFVDQSGRPHEGLQFLGPSEEQLVCATV